MGSDNRITISGGDQRGAVIGNVGATQHNHAPPVDRAAALEMLRSLLANRAPQIVALGRTPAEQAAVEREVANTQRELAAPSPEATAVRRRWNAVLAILGTGLAMNADVAQITQFVIELFS